MLDDHTFGFDQSPPPGSWQAWVRRERPALAAAAWFWPMFLLLALVALFTGWASLPITLSLQVLVSLGAGWAAGRFDRRAYLFGLETQRLRPTRMGAFAGIYLALTTALVLVLVAIWAGLGSFGTLVPLMIPYFAALPVELAFCGLAGALGGWVASLRTN
jgi:hypothetical protein